MSEPLLRALARMRGHLLDPDALVRAVASGRQKGQQPKWRRVEFRYVELKAGRHLQVTAYDESQAHTSNHAVGDDARDAVDTLLDEPFANWHVDTTTQTHQVRVTKRLEAVVHSSDRDAELEVDRDHDRDKNRLLGEDDPVFIALGLSDSAGRMKPSRQAKYRQVEEFLRDLAPVVDDAVASGRVPTPTDERPLRVVDLGCGNAYLTFAAHRYLSHVRGLPVRTIGVDVKAQSREHNAAVAEGLGLADELRFVQGDIATAELDERPDVVLALHACDTATDEALARAVRWGSPVVLAAPCCHHDVQRQIGAGPGAPEPYTAFARHGILRERFADVLTDALRAQLLRMLGYKVDVVEFVDSRHTPRNAMVRAVRTGSLPKRELLSEYRALTADWNVHPALARMLDVEVARVLAR
jgi:SAM-dependent methyltransferase